MTFLDKELDWLRSLCLEINAVLSINCSYGDVQGIPTYLLCNKKDKDMLINYLRKYHSEYDLEPLGEDYGMSGDSCVVIVRR